MSGNNIIIFQTKNNLSGLWNLLSADNTSFYVSNLMISGGTLTIGNSSVNTVINSTFSGVAGGYNGQSLIPNSNDAYVLGSSGNVFANLSIGQLITVGNSSINSIMNSSFFSGTSNNSNMLGGEGIGFFANVTDPSFSQLIGIGSNVIMNTSSLMIGNGTVNGVINSHGVQFNNSSIYVSVNSGGFSMGNLSINQVMNGTAFIVSQGSNNGVLTGNSLSIGNSVQNSIINSTAFSGHSNDSSYFGGEDQSYYANITSPQFSVSVNVGSNLQINTSTIFIGNSTVHLILNSSSNLSGGSGGGGYSGGDLIPTFDDSSVIGNSANRFSNLSISDVITIGNSSVKSTINSTAYSGTVNNSTNFGGQGIGYFSNSTGPIFSVSVNVGSNVSINTSGLFIGNSTVNNFINSTSYSGIANDSLSLGGQGISYFSNVTSPIFTTSVNVGSNVGLSLDQLYIGNSTANTIIGNSGLQILVGSSSENLYLNSIGLFIGNSTVSSLVNSTTFTGISNNSTYLNGVLGSSYALSSALTGFALIAGQTFTGDVNVGSNVVMSSTQLYIGNSTVNTTFGNSGLIISLGTGAVFQNINGSAMQIGNTTVNSVVNSTVFTGTANNTLFVGSTSAANVVSNTLLTQNLAHYALIAGQTFTGDVNVGSNVVMSLSNLLIGNSTVNTSYGNGGISTLAGTTLGNSSLTYAQLFIGNSTVSNFINSTSYTGISNNALFLGGTIASSYTLTSALASYALIAGQTFTGDVNVGSNVVMSLSSMYVGNSTVNTIHSNGGISTLAGVILGNSSLTYAQLFIGNSTVSSLVNSTIFTGISNNSTYLNGVLGSSYALTSALSSYAPLAGATFTGDVNVGSNVIMSVSGLLIGNSTVNTTHGNGGLSILGGFAGVPIGNITLNTTALFIGNSSISATMNATTFSGTSLLANNASFLGGTAAASYQLNSGMSANVVTLTSNDTLFVGTVSAANVVSNAQLQSNLLNFATNAQMVSNLANYALIAGQTFTGDVNVGSNVVISLSNILVGNSTVNSTHSNLGISTLAGITLGNSSLTYAQLFIGNSTVSATMNSTIFSGESLTSNNSSFLGGVGSVHYLTDTGNYTIDGLYNFIANITVNGSIIANGIVGGAGQVLTSGGAGGQNVYWSTVTGGGGTTNPAGSNTQIQFNSSGSFGADANLTWNFASEFLQIGNSTVLSTLNSTTFYISGATINSSFYTGESNTSNVASFIGVLPAANVVSNAQLIANLVNYALLTGADFSGDVNVGSNVIMGMASLLVGNSTVNTIYGNAGLSILGGFTTGNLSTNSTTLFIGNSTVSATMNSSIFSGTSLLSNNAAYLGGTIASSYALTSALASYAPLAGAAFTGQVNVGSNVNITTTNLTVGNSTVNTVHVNAGLYVLGGITGGNVTLNSTQLYIGNITSNVTINTGTISIGNSGTSATINSTFFSGTSNNTSFVGTVAAGNVVSNTQLSQNLAFYALLTGANFSGTVDVGSNVILSTSSLMVGNSTVNTTHSNSGMSTLAGVTLGNSSLTYSQLFIGNSTVSATVNSTIFTGTANNATNLGGVASGSYALSSALTSYALLAGAQFSGTVNVGSNVNLSTSQLIIGNSTVNTTHTNSGLSILGGFAGVPIGNITINSTALFIGNSTVSATMNATTFSGTSLLSNNAAYLGGTIASSYALTSALSSYAPLAGAAFTGGINVGSNTVLSLTNMVIGNSTVNTTHSNGGISTLAGVTLGNSSLTYAQLFIGNSTVSTTVNSSIFSGTSLLANNSLFLGGTAAASYALSSALASYALLSGATFSGPVIINANLSIAGALFANGSNGSLGQVLTSAGTGDAYWSTVSAGGGAVGTDTQIAYNNAGTESGDANLTWLTASALLSVGNSTVNNQINSTMMTGTANNATNFGGHAVSFFANVTTPSIATTVTVGNVVVNTTAMHITDTITVGNVSLNSTTLFIGNSTVSDTINSTVYTGTANNATNLGGVAAGSYALSSALASYALIAGQTFTGDVNVGSNVVMSLSSLYVGNSTVNSTHTNSGMSTLAGVTLGNSSLTYAQLFIGNSTVSATVNSSVFTGTSLLSNNASFLGGVAAASYALTSGLSIYAPLAGAAFTGGVNVGTNTVLSLTNMILGNSTVNSTISNSGISTLAGVTLGNSSLTYAQLFIGNSTVSSLANSTVYTGTANNATNLGGVASGSYALTSALGAYALLTGAAFTGSVNVGSNVVMSTTSLYVGNSTVNSTHSNSGMSTLAGVTLGNSSLTYSQLFIGNSTVSATVNSTIFTGIANNVSFVGSTSAVNVVSNTQLSQNLALYSLLTGAQFSGTVNVGSNVNISTTQLVIGNSTVNTTHTNSGLSILGGFAGVPVGNITLNSTALFLGNSSVSNFVNSTTYTGTALLSNNAAFLGGTAAASYALSSALTSYALLAGAAFTGSVNVGSNVVMSLSSMYVGNSTVNTTHSNSGMSTLAGVTLGNSSLTYAQLFIGNSTVSATVNSTIFTGTSLLSNNAAYLGGTIASSYALTSALSSYAPLAGATFTGPVKVSANLSVNGAIFLAASNGTPGQVLTSNGTSNAYWSTVTGGGGAVGTDTQISFNNGGTESGDANLTWQTTNTLLTIGTTANVQVNATSVQIADLTGNVFFINASSLLIGNTSLTFGATPQLFIGNSTANLVANSTEVLISNSTISAMLGTGQMGIGNTTVNTIANSLVFLASNSTFQGSLSAGILNVGNSTVNTTINGTSFQVANSTVLTAITNGSINLPGGLIMNWGWVSATSTTGAVTFKTPFTVNAFSVMATPTSNVSTQKAAVTAYTKTGCTILSSIATANVVYYLAIGQ